MTIITRILFFLLGFKVLFLKIFYLFICGEMGREGEREGEKHQCVCTPTGDLAYKPGMCPDWNRTGDPLVHSLCSIHQAIPARAQSIFKIIYVSPQIYGYFGRK